MSAFSKAKQRPTEAFSKSSSPAPQRLKKPGRIPPLSIRLSVEERADLEARAGDLPISVYARGLLFAATALPARLSPRNPTLDHHILGQILAALGRSRIAPHLAELADAARSGSLPLDEMTTAQLHEACHDVAAMRADLMRGLGVEESQ